MELKKGETILTDAALHLPAACLHEAFSKRSGVPPGHFELYYRGKRLEGGEALANWGVGKDATIEVKMRGRGGMGDRAGKQVPEGEQPSPSKDHFEKKLKDVQDAGTPWTHSGRSESPAIVFSEPHMSQPRPFDMPTLGEHEVWPPEAGMLPPVERETMMAKLWGTLAQNLPGRGKGFFVGLAKVMQQRLKAAAAKRRADSVAASSTAPGKKAREEEEEQEENVPGVQAVESLPPSGVHQQQGGSKRGLTWDSSNAETALALSKTYGKFNEKSGEGVYRGITYAVNTANECASRAAMLDRLVDTPVMPDNLSADTLKVWSIQKMEECKELKCAIGDPGAGLRGRTSAGAVVMTCATHVDTHTCTTCVCTGMHILHSRNHRRAMLH